MSEMILKISGKKYDFFQSLEVKKTYNSIAYSFRFTGYFDEENSDHRKIYDPLSYRSVSIFYDDVLILSGTILNVSTQHAATKQPATISGYSRSGVLQDSQIPIENYPLQSDGKTLREIAESLLDPFNIKLYVSERVEDDVDKVYEVTTAKETDTILKYLTELCLQRNIVITSTPGGNVLLTRSVIKRPSAIITEETAVRITLVSNGQSMHSSITVIKQAGVNASNAGEATVNNPYVNVLRPLVKVQSSGDDIDTEKYAERVVKSELRGIILNIELEGWLYPGTENLVNMGDIIYVLSPNNSIFRKTRFFVESVTYKGDSMSKTAILECVLPSVYDEEKIVKVL